jgi:hypothetical protein
LVAGTFARSIMTYPLDSLIQSIQIVEDSIDVAISTTPLQIKNTLKITPSLASDYIQIELGNTELGRSFELAILNSVGQLLHHQKESGNGGNYQVDVSNWAAGTYFVKAKLRHEVVSKSFVKL